MIMTSFSTPINSNNNNNNNNNNSNDNNNNNNNNNSSNNEFYFSISNLHEIGSSSESYIYKKEILYYKIL